MVSTHLNATLLYVKKNIYRVSFLKLKRRQTGGGNAIEKSEPSTHYNLNSMTQWINIGWKNIPGEKQIMKGKLCIFLCIT